jgi:flagellar protein FlbD
VIIVTGLGGDVMVVNVDLIVTIEQTPDTVITLVNGDKLIVRESLDQLVDRTVEFRRRGAAPREAVASAPQGDGHAA